MDIQIDKAVSPTVHTCRNVPFAVKDTLKKELDRMEKLVAIERVEEPTGWVKSMVITTKKNGALRVCLDPQNLNRAIKHQHYCYQPEKRKWNNLLEQRFF